MRHHFTKLLALVAMTLCSLTMWAYDNEPMSVTWSMADGASSTAVVSPTGTVNSSSWSYGDSLVLNSSATATVFSGKAVENVYTLFTRAATSGKLDNKRNKLDKSYVEFTFTPEAGLTFTPTALEFDVAKLGTGEPAIFVEVIQGSTTTSLTPEAVAIAKSDDADPAPHKSFNLTTFPAIVASTGATAVRIYIGKLANNKQVGIADVVISGTVSGEKSTTYTVTFSKGATEALGSAPEAVIASSVTMPTNTSLFKEGYTLTGWTDGTNTYAIGATFNPEANTTLTPVFTANTYTLAQSLSELTVRWDFQRQNGCPETQWEGRTGDMFIQQVSINGKSTDVMLQVNTNPGKFNNASWNDWCQVNEGTTFVFASAEGATVKAFSMSEPKNGSDVKSNVDGNEYSAFAGNIATYATTPTDGHSTMLIKGGGYYRYIDITYPANEALLPLKSLTVDGVAMDGAILAEINASPAYTATFSDNIYTTLPTVVATMLDNSEVAGVPSGTGTTRVYTITDDPNTFTLNVEGIHVYTPTGEEEAVAIKHNEGTVENNVWTNGVYTFTTSGIGSSGGADFKFDANTDVPYTIAVPADVQVKQFILRNFHANYSGGNGQLKTVTSEGATAYLPTRRTALCNVIGGPDNRQYEGEAYDVIVNIENHTAGTPIVFTMLKSAQPMGWIELTTVKVAPTSAPVKTAASVATDDNHAVVAVTFDREIVNEVTATIAGKTLKAKGGSTTLYFPAWDLEYAQNYTLTIAAGAAKDAYNNVTDAAIEILVAIPAKTAVVPAAYDYVVSDVDELLAAIEAVRATNENNANAARKTIFLKNGDYNLGSSAETVLWVRAHNLSLIGESRDGVIIHGNSTGISNPVLNLRYWQGYYLQDLTVRNDFDYGTGSFNGVSVATYGGDKTIMKNVRLLSNQDTQVTGHRVYHEDCAIHGTVDFICGGGDNYYYHTDLVLENRGGNIIVAPSTSASTQWGYVFDHCTIKAVDETAATTNAGSYYLGRPWQNEPRAYYLYTTMEVQGAAAGWTTMGNLPTHFLEYASVDGNSAAIDLSGRTNSPSSTNTYNPVLTADSAAMFTARNVLGGADAWDAASKAAQVAAPVVALSGTTLSWEAVEDALLYVVMKDDAYVANLTATSYSLSEAGNYSVKAANRFGGLGAASNVVAYDPTATGISNQPSEISCQKVLRNGQLLIIRDGKTYNMHGQEVK
ncbi:MAG: hypothetical protein J5761_00460 [Paludibacteraceae bacterium]|nr:hypothetical protein [Paludibacteraceae bacterium]